MKTASPAGLAAALKGAVEGEVRFDAYTRHLFSTDASMYAVEPLGVVFPRCAADVVAAVEVAGRFGVPVLPRGAGTSLCGQTVGRAVVLDFSRHMDRIVEVDPGARIARVEPGVVQDDLNRAAEPHGLFFAPDTSTSNRATLGGMIGNNSCGSRSARYGMTIDHVESLEVVLADGSRARLGPVDDEEVERRAGAETLEGRLYREIPRLVARGREAIRDGIPSYWRRTGGYRLERLLPERGPLDLSKVVVGSEGTLAVVVEATVRLEPRPRAVAALVGHFETVRDAIAAAPSALESGAAAVELMDRFIVDLARRSPVHGELTSVLEGDPGGLLWVEFYGESQEEAEEATKQLEARWEKAGRGYALVSAHRPEEQERFRKLRKAGLGLLMASGEEGERSLAFVEDTAVPPGELVEYTDRFREILERHGLRAGFYGHASAGCLHVRPFMDLTRPGEVETLRAVAEEVCDLVQEFGGMNSSEHGDGLARSEFNRRFFGEELYGMMREVKRIFDPEGRLNPGTKVDAPPMTENLRDPALFGVHEEAVPAPSGSPPRPVDSPRSPLETHFPFDFEDGMRGAANRCMRIGACRKSPDAGGTMCPSFMATREEEHSTRGRANALVKALSMPDPRSALGDDRLHEILDLCLECKACKAECPLSVDMAAMKSEVLAHRHRERGAPLRARLFGHVRTLNRLGSALAPVSNWLSTPRPVRILMEKILGIHRGRPLPRFRGRTFQKWFRKRDGGPSGDGGAPPEGRKAPSGEAGAPPEGRDATPGHGGPHREDPGGAPGEREASRGGPGVPSGGGGAVGAEAEGSGPMELSPPIAPTRGSVLFLADSFTSYTEPEIGRAAVELLERAGWTVRLAGDVCCGRSLVSKGLLDEARRCQAELVERLAPSARAGIPIVGCEPSCLLTLKDEVPALVEGISNGPGSDGEGKGTGSSAALAVASRAVLVEELILEALEDGRLELDSRSEVAGRRILFHGHCHQKAAGAVEASVEVLRRIPGAEVGVLDAGCCGMAGSFGFEEEHYDLSLEIGGLRLFPAVEGEPPDTLLAASGVSCRQQISHGTGRRAEHPVRLVRKAVG